MNFNYVDTHYTRTMGIDIIEGDTLQKLRDVLVNEEVVRLMKWTDGAVGKRLNNFGSKGHDYVVKGVFRNVRNYGLYAPAIPVALIAGSAPHVTTVRLRAPYDESLRRLDAFVREAFPDLSLPFVSMDDLMAYMYHSVSHFRNSVLLTSLFIVFIVLMGLIGYVNDETGRRAKEIAIRKVNGASSADILRLLSRGVLRIAVPCVVLGTVAAWYVGTEWLTQFAGHVNVGLLHFLGLALLLLAVIVGIVVLKAWHIAGENPVESIKTE